MKKNVRIIELPVEAGPVSCCISSKLDPQSSGNEDNEGCRPDHNEHPCPMLVEFHTKVYVPSVLHVIFYCCVH